MVMPFASCCRVARPEARVDHISHKVVAEIRSRPDGYIRGMIIVSGWLRVDAAQRDVYLASCLPVIETARRTEGCRDFHLAADPLEPERINVFERWDTAEAVESFRGSGPEAGQQEMVIDSHVEQHEIASTVSLT